MRFDHSHWRWFPTWVNRTNFAFSPRHYFGGRCIYSSTLWGGSISVKVENDLWRGFATFVSLHFSHGYSNAMRSACEARRISAGARSHPVLTAFVRFGFSGSYEAAADER